jgi:hypothetical protein
LLSPAGHTGAVVNALRESVLEVQGAYESEAQSSGGVEPPFPGNWVHVPDGVLVQIVDCDAFETVLPSVAAGLERRGVEGAFELRHRPKVTAPPRTAHLLEWFAAPFVPFRQRLAPADQPEPPAMLAQARVELAPILYSPGVLAGAGYPDVDGEP